jgi:hypothetical protein
MELTFSAESYFDKPPSKATFWSESGEWGAGEELDSAVPGGGEWSGRSDF